MSSALSGGRVAVLGAPEAVLHHLGAFFAQHPDLLAVRVPFVPTAENIAKELDVSTEEVVEMQKRMAAPDASLNAPLGSEDDDNRTRMDLLEDDADEVAEIVAGTGIRYCPFPGRIVSDGQLDLGDRSCLCLPQYQRPGQPEFLDCRLGRRHGPVGARDQLRKRSQRGGLPADRQRR